MPRRRKPKRSVQARQEVKPQTSKDLRGSWSYVPLKGMTRREAIGRLVRGVIGIGAASLGSKYLARRIERHYDVRPPHSLAIEFGAHGSGQDARTLIRHIENAKAKGRPVHVFFVEDAISDKNGLEKFVRGMNRDFEGIRNDYSVLRRRGLSDGQAKEMLRTKFRQVYPRATPFDIERDIHLAINNVHIMPIEAYSGRELEERKRQDTMMQRRGQEYSEIINKGGSLLELQRFELRQAQDAYEATRARDKHIIRNLETSRLFGYVQQFFPELKDQEIRGLAHLGGGHRNVSLEFNPLNRKIELTELLHDEKYSLKKYAAYAARGSRPINERDARLEALGTYFDINVEGFIRNLGEPLVARAYRKALGITQQEFEDLSR